MRNLILGKFALENLYDSTLPDVIQPIQAGVL